MINTTKPCLNCGREVSLNYCENCGQKTSTHRFSLKHLILHDVLHELMHIDKGFFNTCRLLLVRSGSAVREYVEGGRMKLMNPLPLLLLLSATGYFLAELSGIRLEDVLGDTGNKELTADLDDLSKKYPKLVIMFSIPLYSVVTWIIFRKSRQNFAEHLVMNTYRASGEMIIGIFFTLFTFISRDIHFIRVVYWLTVGVSLVYSVFFYFLYFRNDYQRKVMLYIRSFLSVLILLILVSVSIAVITLTLYKKMS